ncbi:unnamed protein product [Effrenium voratum]|uniref:Uncharacterized protein n=1 Tax=Effrenium voratum TaxID=2562239 RepID=A0AA36JHK5_9DINO|nr:unnamed protein product [Effrenium voratum]CAJ1405777.1 unnamed protein product [Effrenium voratum]CAJ1415479.1 unnamed protein product [Effrenium voratum]
MSEWSSLAPSMFCGDGQYVGDGGAALERLWAGLRWREIRNCPGRYTTPDKEARELNPSQLLRKLGLDQLEPLMLRLPGKDPILMVRLVGGGGLLSYLKGGSLFVHTFNTESGLIRKVDALQWPDSELRRLLEPESRSCAEAFRGCLAVLPFLLDSEK